MEILLPNVIFMSLYPNAYLLSSSLLSKNIKIKIYRTIILTFVLYGRETWLLTLKGELRLRVFESSMLRRVFGPKTSRENYIMRSLMICTHQILFQ